MKKWSVLIMLLFLAVQANCTHLRAGYITYEVVNAASRTYRITVTAYTDSEPSDPVLFGEGILDFGDGIFFQIPIINNNERYTVLDDGIISIDALSTDGLQNEVSWAQLVIEHTYSEADTYLISYTEPNRNAGILNMDNSVNTSFHTETLFEIDPFLGSFNSANFIVPPVFQTSADSLSLSLAVKSERGIRVRYDLTTPMSERGTSVSGYQTPPGVSLNRISGLFTWGQIDPFWGVGEYNFAVKISQFIEVDKKFFLTGYVVYDFQVIRLEGINSLSVRTDEKLDENGGILVLPGETVDLTTALSVNNSGNELIDWEVFSEFEDGILDIAGNGSSNPIIINLRLDVTEEIARDNPYLITIRANSISDYGGFSVIDHNILLYTRQEEFDFSQIVVGLKEKSDSEGYVYPNPVSETLYIDVENIDVTIFNTKGATVNHAQIEGKKLQVGGLSEGQYLIRTSDGKTYRFIKQN